MRVDGGLDHRHVDQVVGLVQRHKHRGYLGDVPGNLRGHRRGPLDPDRRFLREALDVGEHERGVVLVRVVPGGFLEMTDMKFTPVSPGRLALRSGLEDGAPRSLPLPVPPHDVQVGQRIGPGEVRAAGDAVQADPFVRLRRDGQVVRCVLDQGDGLVRDARRQRRGAPSLPILASASAAGTSSSRAFTCRPSDAFSARMRRRASCRRCSVMTPDL